MKDNFLHKYFLNNGSKTINKWIHYFDIYERYFNQYVDKPILMIEIGVFKGGSIDMWKEYFGTKSIIVGIDINPDCKSYEEDQIEIFIGSQDDENFLNSIKNKIGPIDIIIDDGSHMMEHQILTFKVLYDAVKENGIYLCEDTHTSYWGGYRGGYKRPDTFIEYSKNFIDDLHAWYCNQLDPWKYIGPPSKYTTTLNAIHWYDSIVIFEKLPRTKSKILIKGQ
jgi:cephalosporin hydroxylase